jgi:two-component sensor histidine kinase
MLTSAQTQAVAMVINELGTKAAKYGALSRPDGSVSVNWDHTGANVAVTLTITWRELGGPPIAAPIQSGYGSRLIRDLIPFELGGTVVLKFPADGVLQNCHSPEAQISGIAARRRDGETRAWVAMTAAGWTRMSMMQEGRCRLRPEA